MSSAKGEGAHRGVAIIGMAGRFPGADTVTQLWHNLCDGVESITFFKEHEIDPSIPDAVRTAPQYVKARGIVHNVEMFDAAFFGIHPREAEIMDPQQRIFLETSWEALENAGYHPESFDGLIGVFAGMANNTYFPKHIAERYDLIDKVGEFQIMLANEKDFLATRVSHKLNLTGPSISVYTGCSTSLVAVCQAFFSLMNYQCDLALAGGVTITTPQSSGYLWQEGGIESPDGHCRPFDARAQGTVFSNGAGIVVLKRVEDALAHGDYIYAVIRGAAINNDGSDKVSFAAPSVKGQAEVIAMAQALADVDPATISYVETHGTATQLGDPIEIEALAEAFRPSTTAPGTCALGSIKSNFGHLLAASGVAGLIKTALALQHGIIPPTLHFEKTGPQIDFSRTPFYINTQRSEWKTDKSPRRAGVSSFGIGGTNAHVVLEEPPPADASGASRPQQLLMLSAKTMPALDAMTEQLCAHLRQHEDICLPDAAFTLQQGRKSFPYRRFVVCGTTREAVAALASPYDVTRTTRKTDSRDPDVVFMYPGHGARYARTGADLYRNEPVFRASINRCADILAAHGGYDLRGFFAEPVRTPGSATSSDAGPAVMSPALFMLEFALTELWKSWGIKPKALIGHAVGEFVAACVAGIFSLEDALMLVAQLSRLARDLPAGPLLSVALSADEAQRRLNQNLALAAIYRPDLCLVTGTPDAVTALQGALAAEGVSCACVQTAHAFYPMLPDAIITAFSQTVDRVKRSAPQIPLIASATGTWITDAQALDAAYWLTPVRSACLFSAGLREVLRGRQRVLLEAGPGGMLSECARQLVSETPGTTVISSLPCADERHAEHAAVLTAAGRLWLCGAPLDGAAFYSRERRRRIPLPTYPFERERFWIAPTARSAGAAADAAPADDTIAGKKKQPYARERGVPARLPGTPSPRTETERALMDMCRFALQAPGIGTHDNLFPDGRNPSAAAEIVRQVQNRFNLRIDEQLVLDHPTVAGLAGCLDQKLNAQSSFHHARSRAQLKREALSTRTQKLKGDDHEQ